MCSVFAGFALVLAGKPELTLSPPNELLEGETLTIKCVVPDKDLFHFVKLYRKIGNTLYTLSTNQNIEEKIAADGRYQSVDYSEVDRVATLHFKIDSKSLLGIISAFIYKNSLCSSQSS